MSLNQPEPAPVVSDAPASWDLVIADIESNDVRWKWRSSEHEGARDLVLADMRERDAFGAAKYGVRHQAYNGRDHLVDAYQETLDQAMYLRASLVEKRDNVILALYHESLTIVLWLRAEILRRSGR